MAKQQSLIVFDAKMYKHFALITVALTAAMALFADGEKRAVVTKGAAAAQEYVQEIDTGPKLLIRNPNAGGGAPGLQNFYGSGGESITGSGFAASSVGATRRLSKIASGVTEAQLARFGMSKEQFLALSDEEKEKILTQLNNGKSPVVAENTVQNSTSASLRRSGVSGPSADY